MGAKVGRKTSQTLSGRGFRMPRIYARSRNHLRSHGISPIKSSKIRIRPLPLLFKVDIIGVYRYCNLYPRALAMVASGKINLKPLISKTFQLEVSDCPSQGGFARSTPRL